MKYQPELVSNTTLGRNCHVTANSVQITIVLTFFPQKFDSKKRRFHQQ